MLFYRSMRALFWVVAPPMFRFVVEGRERVPRSGAAVVVAAHRSWLDPACVGGAFSRPVRFLIMESVYRKRWATWFYRRMGGIPVGVGGGALTVGALRGALRALQRGELIGVFPEGRVVAEGPLGELYGGAALLAVRAPAPVIPVVIQGSARAWPRGRRCPRPARVRVRIGEAISPPAARDREALTRFLARIREGLDALAREAERCSPN